MKKKIVFFTGSGISKAAGIPTFREAGEGLWENYDVMEVCTAGCFERDPEKAYGFYSYLHSKYHDIQPTKAHRIIAALEGSDNLEVVVVTQNVDDLHEKSGSTHVIHLHGELSKIQAVDDSRWVRPWDSSVVMHEDVIIEGHKIRPHVVMFGEDVPKMSEAINEVMGADILVIIGTSLVVYPAASLIDFVDPEAAEVVYIDPSPTIDQNNYPWVKVIKDTADSGLTKWTLERGYKG